MAAQVVAFVTEQGNKMDITLRTTERGFLRGAFKDRYGADCSIQESSLAEEPAIWLGCERQERHPVTGEPLSARMHLTQDMAAVLIRLLTIFVHTGGLGPPRTTNNRADD